MRYLKEFANESEYDSFVNNEYIEPNISHISEGDIVRYNQNYGVYIQHKLGMLFRIEEWESCGFRNEDANGIAVIDKSCAFVIAKDSLPSKVWPSEILAIEGIMTTSDESVAITDFAGKPNTELIAASPIKGVAYDCYNHIFPNGGKGYLPALGELQVAYNHKEDIDIAANLIGGVSMSGYLWSSTQYPNNRIWVLSWDDGDLSGGYKYNPHEARPFTTL